MPITTYPQQIQQSQGSLLGRAQTTTTQTTTNTVAPGDNLTGLAVTVTVPAGRTLLITGFGFVSCTVAAAARLTILDENSNYICDSGADIQTTGATEITALGVVSPTAGTHTFRLAARTSAGTLTFGGYSTIPGLLLVEDITGFQNPYGGQAIPVGLLAQAIVTTNQGSIVNTATNITGLSATITVPAGRVLRAQWTVYPTSTVSADHAISQLFMDGASIDEVAADLPTAGRGERMVGSTIISPSAGTHTFQVNMWRQQGTGTLTSNAATNYPATLEIADITSTPAPANTAPSALLGQVVSTVSQGTGLGIGIGTTNTALTNLLVTVTVGAGRTLRINGHACFRGATAGMAGNLWIQEGATQLSVTPFWIGNTVNDFGVEVSYVLSPSAGTHTYQLYAQTATSTMSMQAGAGEPAFITVEDITGAAVPTYSVGSMPLATVASEAWNTFTPVWSTPSGGTAPAIGNGTLACRYTKIGRTVIGTMRLLPGSTTTFGTAGNKWCLSLPFPAQTAISIWAIVGSAKLWGGGASQNVLVRLDGNAPNNLSLWYHATWPAGTEQPVDATHPWTWANGHDVDIQFMYEAVA